MSDLAALTAPGARVVANLPYYITADVIQRLLLRGPGYESVAVMVQKEAAERMTSLPGDKQWCHLAALVRYFGKPQILEEIPPEAFEPSPHVVSAFLRIDLYRERPVRPKDEALFLRVLAAAFAMRRKTLQNNLRAAFSLSAAQRIPFPVPDPLPLSYLLRPLRDDALRVDRIVVRSALHSSPPSAAQVFFGADPGQ